MEAAPTPRMESRATWEEAKLLGGFTIAALVSTSADRELQRIMQKDWVQQSSAFRHAANVFNPYGSPGVLVGSAALFTVGWVGGRADVARLGLRAGETIMLSGIVTGGIKGIAGRTRPYASPGKPGDFRLMGGTHDEARQSFPSGHTTAAFALAAALDQELRVSHPDAARWAGPALYVAATMTGLARMYTNNHWASDVVMGAGIGVVSGLVVARFHADRPAHWIDRRLLPHDRR